MVDGAPHANTNARILTLDAWRLKLDAGRVSFDRARIPLKVRSGPCDLSQRAKAANAVKKRVETVISWRTSPQHRS